MRRGLSLAELLVALGIMSIVTIGAFMIISEGLHLFRANQAASDAQDSTLKALGRLTTELTNSKHELTRWYPNPTGGIPASVRSGIVFASPLTSDGTAQFHPVTGKIFWQKLICYYLEPNPSNASKGQLFRKELLLANGPDATGGLTGDCRLSTVESQLASTTTNTFAANTSLETRMLGDGISLFSISAFDGTVATESGTTSVLGGSTLSDRRFALDISLAAGDEQDRGPDSYYIRIDSRVVPRS